MLVVVGCVGLAACGGGSPGPTYPPLTGARAVSVGTDSACATMNDGSAVCWGLNVNGSLGDGNSDSHLGPSVVKDLAGVQSIETGQGQSCAIGDAGLVWCWGSNSFGQLANGEASFRDHPTPALTTELSGPMIALATSDTRALCGVLTTGTVECWGSDIFGLAPPTSHGYWISPTPLPGLTGVRALALGDFFGCALLADGTVSCWGSGALGQAGEVLSTSATPLPVAGLTGAVEIAAGRYHACARLTNGDVWCWGSIAFDATSTGAPVRVAPLSDSVSISARVQATCSVQTSGAVRCAGLVTANVAHATSVSVGDGYACAVIDDGTIKCWGDRNFGVLGNGQADVPPDPTIAVTVAAPGSTPAF